MQYLIKVLLSAILIVVIAEVGKRNVIAGALTTSLPVVSILGFMWLYWDTHDVEKIANLSTAVFWLVIPSLVLFLVWPFLLHYGLNFWMSLLLSCGATVVSYLLMVKVLAVFKIFS